MVRPGLVVLCMCLLIPMPASGELAVWDYLVPASADRNDDVGAAIAVDMPWLAVGAPGARAVHLYHFDGGWTHQQTLSTSSATYGATVAINGDRLAVGAPNADRVYLYRLDGKWHADGELRGGEGFGTAIDMEGDMMAIGAPGALWYDVLASSGEVQIFEDDNGWTLRDTLKRGGIGAETRFGAAVDLDGDRLLIGAPARVVEDEVFGGAAYMFRHASGWIEEARLEVDDEFAQGGSFGSLVALSGNHAMAGAPGRIVDGLFYYGHVLYFEKRGASWTEMQRDYTEAASFAMEGNRAILGAAYFDYTVILAKEGTSWKRVETLQDRGAWYDSNFGDAVALQGDQVFVGAPEQDTHEDRTGAVWTFIDNLPPVAVAGDDILQTIDDPDGLARVALDGSASYDPDGRIADHRWSWGKKTVHAAETAFFMPVGTHTLKLRVTDDKGFSDTDELQVQVKAEPRLKASFAFSPDRRDPGTPIQFTDTTLSEIGTIVQWDWDFDGDGRTDATGHAPVHKYAASGDYAAQLTVRDHLGNEATATKTVRVSDAPPIADAGDDIVVTKYSATGQGVATLDATSSRDPEGALRDYQWSIDGIPIGEGETLEWNFNIGVTEVDLRVTDGAGQRDRDTVSVLVPRGGPNGTQSFNSDPDVSGSWQQIEGPRLIEFRDHSVDDETDIAFVAWDFDEDGDSDSEQPEVIWPWHQPGAYTISHRATDMDGTMVERSFEIQVNDMPPEAAFTPVRIDRVPLGAPVVFFDESRDLEDPIAAWKWDFDGATSNRQDVGHIFDRPGVHNITLTVTDTAGQTSTATGSLEVYEVDPRIASNWTQDEALELEANGEDAFPLPGEPGYEQETFNQADDEDEERPDAEVRRTGPWRITEEDAAPEPKIWWLWMLLGVVLLILVADQNRRRRRRKRMRR